MNARWLLIIVCYTTAQSRGAAPDPPPVVVLKLIPAAEPVPALKYRLLPDLREQTPGNAITAYGRAFSPEWQSYSRKANWNDKIEKALELPLAELRGSATAKDVDWVTTWPMLPEVDRAARRAYCDWELTDRLRQDGMNLLVPDVQGLRNFARLLAVRARLEMAEGKFAAAARTLQTGYAMARHAGEGPTLIHGLVGLAVASIMNKQVETWSQTPGSPNLYWALTDLPMPFIDLRKCLQGERIFMDNLLPQMRECLSDPARPPFSQEQMREMAGKISRLMGGELNMRDQQTFSLAIAAVRYSGAKKFLAEQGWTAAQIDAMPALQAVFLQELFEYDRLFDLLARGANLPYLQGRRTVLEGEEQLKRAAAGSPLTAPSLARTLLPTISRVTLARTRLDRQFAALRTIEAIRLYAAANEGKLPAKLDVVRAVPIPLDPITGKAFEYTLTGDKASLVGIVPPGESPSQLMRFEITIGK